MKKCPVCSSSYVIYKSWDGKRNTCSRQCGMIMASIKKRGIRLSGVGFWENVRKTNGCWLGLRYKDKNGYGKVTFNQKVTYAHRIAYILTKGKIRDGMQLDHLCRNPSCVNPDHLDVVTNRENCLRGISPAAINARKDFCIRGHALTGRNVYRNGRIVTASIIPTKPYKYD